MTGRRDNIRRPVFLVLLSVIFLSLIRCEYIDKTKSNLIQNEGNIVKTEGVVLNVSIRENYVSFVVKTKGEKCLVKLENPSNSDWVKYYSLIGRKIKVSGKVSVPKGRRNSLGFDYRRYLKSRGIYTIITSNRFKITGLEVKRILLNFLNIKKAEFLILIKENLGKDNFGIVSGILFGDSEYLSEEIYKDFKANGIAHILAVSGLHVNLAYDIVKKTIGRKNKKLSDICGLSFVFIYAVLADFSLSVLRASLMILLKTLAFYFGKRYDSVSAASVCAIVFLLINPYKLFDSGLQLSFTAAFCMSIVLPWLECKFGKIADRLKSERIYSFLKAAAPTITVFVGTSPLIAFSFLCFSPASIILNPLAISLAALFLPVALASFFIFSFFPSITLPLLSFVFTRLLSALCDCFLFINKLGNYICSNTDIAAPPLGLLIVYYVFFFFFFSETRYILFRKHKFTLLASAEIIMFVSACIVPWRMGITNSPIPWNYGLPEVSFLDVGQGDCIHIHTGSTDILIDGGGNYYGNIAEDTLKPYLLKNGINNIDLAIITHSDMDHSKGIYELSEIFDVKEIISNHDIYEDEITDENNQCLVSKLNIDNLDFLLMGDAGFEREYALLSDDILCDVIKLGHHGSKYSTSEEFLKKAAPSFAVISVGKNNYGHPSERVIELLQKLGIIYARTDECGAICLRKCTDEYFIFENAAKDKRWLIPRKHQESILPEQ